MVFYFRIYRYSGSETRRTQNILFMVYDKYELKF